MNNALIKNHAVSGRPAARLAGLVRHGVVACVLACTAAGAMANGQDRNVRRDEMRDLHELRKEGEISQDDEHRAEEELQKLTDGYEERVEAALADKEAELSEV